MPGPFQGHTRRSQDPPWHSEPISEMSTLRLREAALATEGNRRPGPTGIPSGRV